MTAYRITVSAFFYAILFLLLLSNPISAQSESASECLMCHADVRLSMERDGRKVSLYINDRSYTKSVHGEFDCIDCHDGFDAQNLPHKEGENIAEVDCSLCHSEAVDNFVMSTHGKALEQGRRLAPNCASCHGKHNILPNDDVSSPTYVMNIPTLCGKCHKEGTQVSQLQTVSQHNILENYSQSIHGYGLFTQGLIVTAVCTSCHMSHKILEHENPESSINRNNIAKTCMNCHSLIEQVHRKIIDGELWESRPNVIPICVDCHSPHEIRSSDYAKEFADEMCMSCHSDKNLSMMREGVKVSLYVDSTEIQNSIHSNSECVRCHANVSRLSNPVCVESGPVDCSMCHEETGVKFEMSSHYAALQEGEEDAPDCKYCHGDHNVLSRLNNDSPIFARNIPSLCSKCHEGELTTKLGRQENLLLDYTESVHGKGLLESGLVVAATCASCHDAHLELPAEDPKSSVHVDNIPKTCAKCHEGIFDQFSRSIHSPNVSDTDDPLPVCEHCHGAHKILGIEESYFRGVILDQCGGCHETLTKSYFETMHGKASKLGNPIAAKCSDCHGAHQILPPGNPESTLSRENVVETCKQCHPNSNKMFVGYLTHATHHDRDKYPILYYTFWFMTYLLIGTFTFFGLHTLLWLPRAFKEKRRMIKELKEKGIIHAERDFGIHIQRFDAFSRFLHVLVIISFLSLAVTGMTIKFANVEIFRFVSALLGGYEVTTYIHRVGAVITFIYFVLHVWYLLKKKKTRKKSWKEFLTGENTMVPNWHDVKEFGQTMKWFFGFGPRPKYGRYTYWEKFDYLAVFWGVTVIGISGLILWFPEFFTALGLPGWLINIATIVHSDEALLAAGFIFTVHFFNTHFRPDKFPMDPVIFTGSMEMEEFKYDRPREYEAYKKEGRLDELTVAPPNPILRKIARIFGFTALAIGLITITLIIISMLFFYE